MLSVLKFLESRSYLDFYQKMISRQVCLRTGSDGFVVGIEPGVPDLVHAGKILFDILDPDVRRQEFGLVRLSLGQEMINLVEASLCLRSNPLARRHLATHKDRTVVNDHLRHARIVRAHSKDTTIA